jgi:hypothetical protein
LLPLPASTVDRPPRASIRLLPSPTTTVFIAPRRISPLHASLGVSHRQRSAGSVQIAVPVAVQ